MSAPPIAGLYLLADESIRPFADWTTLMPALLRSGVRLVQYRAKQIPAAQQRAHAEQLLGWCREQKIPLLINDDVRLCQDIGAQGVHLGRSDGAVAAARQALPAGSLVGHSCYADLNRARSAIAQGASYVSFGRLFASSTKPEASPAGLDIISRASAQLNVPICGIGGIDADNALRVRTAGAQLLCVGAGVLGQPDPVAACQKLATIAG